MRARLLPVLACLLVIPTGAVGQEKKSPAPDHGHVLATCLDVAPGPLKDTTNLAQTRNYVFRGRVISLDRERTVSLCFDTEHMRVAGAWVGQPMRHRSDKNMGPPVEGRMLFTTRPGPGWAKEGRWDDPRPGQEGPLPRDWAHYRGLYLHGERVVLSYSVGDCPVLELPACAQSGELRTITRTLNLGPSPRPLTLLVCEEAKATGSLRSLTGKGADAELAIIASGEESVVTGVTGAPPGTAWELADGRIHLKLPALPGAVAFRLTLARLPVGQDLAPFTALLEGPVENLERLTQGGPTRWTPALETRGARAANDKPYVVDTIEPPSVNPWHASIRFGGLDFFPDGRAALCTWDGDVWIVSGLDESLERVRWRRFAAGLHQPLGLKIIKGIIHTADRDQVTRLHDLNGDGEADFYENFNNDAGLTLQRHEFVMDLETDAAGNLYYCRSGHYIVSKQGANCCVYKLTPDGQKLEVFARGFREPNGLSIGPDGTMTVGGNEGNGIPQTPIYRLVQGGMYGFTPVGMGDDKSGWKEAHKPIVWLPKHVDMSAGGQLWVPPGRWGPFAGQLLHTSYGNSALFALLIDRQAEPWQGAVWKFPLAFESGLMRGRFSPSDGRLYVCGLRGWGTNAARDGQFCRVRYTGQTTPVPVGLQVTKAGIALTFSDALDKAVAEDDQNWTGDWSVPTKAVGKFSLKKEELPIEAVHLSNDRKTVTIALEQMRPAMNYTLEYRLRSAAGIPVVGALHGTIHQVR